jgi:hypothetical protein
MGKWVFEQLTGAAMRRGPQEAELFKSEQAAEGEYAGNDALVREVLQNALDARRDAEPVRVRLAIHEAADAPPAARLAYYFSRLSAPLVNKLDFDAAGVPQYPCRFLVCEDFGTRGLEGDVLRFSDPASGDTSAQFFYWFWRNTGRSGKTGDELGRWGLGKLVYRAASRVGGMLGMTVRASDAKRFLMGQTVLQVHSHEGVEFHPEGFWCDKQGENGLPLPIGEGAEFQQFCQEWRITRTKQPGLSVVSPFIPPEIQAERLLQAVAVHFFTRILQGDLAVEVCGGALGSVTLDAEGLVAACKKVKWDGPKRMKRHAPPPIAFAKACLSATPSAVTKLLGEEKVPKLADDAFAPEVLAKLRPEFSSGELVSVRVRMWLLKKKGPGAEGVFDVHLQRDAEGDRQDTYFVREGMTITKINSRAAQRGIRALVVVGKGPLAELLGDTEGPAHEDWDTSQERPEKIWKTWKGRVAFVRGIVDSLVEVLTPPTTEPDFDLLSDFFSIERVEGKQHQRAPGDQRKEKPVLPPIAINPKWYHITERAGGFSVSRNSAIPMPADAALRVAVAYDLPRGDPLSNWSPIDFQFSAKDGNLKLEGKGVTPKKAQGNILVLKELQPDFALGVDGFDRHRDLFVRVDELTAAEENGDD